MDDIRKRLLALLPRLRLSEPDQAEYSAEIQAAQSLVELRILIAELQALAGDDLLALADGLEALGSVTEAGRIRVEARQAQAPFQAMAHWRESKANLP